MKKFEQLADVLLLIERPECAKPAEGKADPVFIYEINGRFYALAFWALRSTLYTEAYKRVIAPARVTGCLRQGGYPAWSFSLATKEKKFKNGNMSWIPIMLPNAPSTPELIRFAEELLHPKQDAAAQA